MSRLTFVQYITPEQRQHVDACVRAYGYAQVDRVNEDLAGAGIKASRSAIFRHAQRLKIKDAETQLSGQKTLITLVAVGTGQCSFAVTDQSLADVLEALKTTCEACSIQTFPMQK